MTGDLKIFFGMMLFYHGFAEDFEFEIHDSGFVDIVFHIEGRAHSYGGMHMGWIFMEAEVNDIGKAS